MSSSVTAAAAAGAGAGAAPPVFEGRKAPGAPDFAVAVVKGVLPKAVAAAAEEVEETLGSVSGAERASPSLPRIAVARLGLVFFCWNCCCCWRRRRFPEGGGGGG